MESATFAIGDPGYGADAGDVDVFRGCPAYSEVYGTGWPGTNGVPMPVALSDPGLGKTLRLHVDNSRGVPTIGLLLVGLEPDSIPTSAGGTLLVKPLAFLHLTLPQPGLDVSWPVPNDQTRSFLNVYLQALEHDPGASHDISFSNGLRLVFGFDLP